MNVQLFQLSERIARIIYIDIEWNAYEDSYECNTHVEAHKVRENGLVNAALLAAEKKV